MIIANLSINLLGLLTFLFIFWKRLKEDYASEIIFKSASYIFLGMSIFYLISFNFIKDWFLWFSFFGGVLGLILAFYSQKVRFYESFESFVISSLPWISLMFLTNSIQTSSLISFSGFVVMLILMFLAYWLEANYKKFFWYKSGKIGLSGLIILAVILTFRLTVAIFKIDMLSLVSLEKYLSGAFLILDIFLIYKLART